MSQSQGTAPTARPRGRRRGLIALSALATVPLVAIPASAAITPVAQPHHIEAFPSIDMAGAHGFTTPFVMQVWREGVLVGSSGAPSTANPLELNHDGPPCWSGVTPDIIPGDQIRVVDAATMDSADPVGEYMTVANIDADPAVKVALDPDGIRNDIVMTGTATTLDGSAKLELTHLSAELVQPAWRDNGWKSRALGAVPGLPIPNATTPFPDGGDGVLVYDAVSPTNPIGNHWTAMWKNLPEPHASLALEGEQMISYFERDDGLEGSGLTIMDAEDTSGGAGTCPAAASDAVVASTPANANIQFVNGTNAMQVSGTAFNAASVRLTLDDSDAVSTDAVTVVAVPTNAAPTGPTATPMGNRRQTFNASFANAAFDALADGDLTISAEFDRVVETEGVDANNAVVYNHTVEKLPGRALVVTKDTVAPAAPTAFPGSGNYTTAQSVTVSPGNEIEDTIRYRVGATAATTAEPTAASGIVPAPLSVTSSQSVKLKSFDRAGNPSSTTTLNYTIGPADTQLPTVPTLTATVASGSQVNLSWTAATDNVGLREYVVYADGVAQPPIAPTAARTWQHTGLAAGSTHTYRVEAVDTSGNRRSSATLTRTTTGTQTGIAATPTIGTATVGVRSVTANWTPASTGAAATSFRVQVINGAGTVVRTATATATQRTLTVTGLRNNTTYRTRVAAVNAAGTSANSANSNAVRTPAPPTAPVIGTASAGVAGGAVNATARWNPPTSDGRSPVTGYRVFALRMSATGTVLSTTQSAVLPATQRALTMGLAAGNYRFQVVAINAVGTSPRSARSALVTAR